MGGLKPWNNLELERNSPTDSRVSENGKYSMRWSRDSPVACDE